MKKLFQEFKTFAIKGNMLDMAVGIIVGGAFTAIITSIVTNVALPLLSILIGFDFKDWEIILPRLYGNGEQRVLGIGLFINSVINFIVLAFVVFLFVKALNRFRKREEETVPEDPPEPTKEELLLVEIRDLLRQHCGMGDKIFDCNQAKLPDDESSKDDEE